MTRHPRWPLTRLGLFMDQNGITNVRLAERSGLSMRYIAQLRYGRCDPTRKTMLWLAGAASDILGSYVEVYQLFDLDFEWEELPR